MLLDLDNYPAYSDGDVPRTILNHFTRNNASLPFALAGFFFVTTSSESESESDWDAAFLDFDFDFDSSLAGGAKVAYSEATMEYEVTTTCAAFSFRGSVLHLSWMSFRVEGTYLWYGFGHGAQSHAIPQPSSRSRRPIERRVQLDKSP